MLALTAQISELKKRHRHDVQTLRDALEQAHGENLDLRRQLARRGTGIHRTSHVALNANDDLTCKNAETAR